jgi:hypothetical protein
MAKERKPPNYNTFLISRKGVWSAVTLTDSELNRALRRGESEGFDDDAKRHMIRSANKGPLVVAGMKYYMVDAFKAGI